MLQSVIIYRVTLGEKNMLRFIILALFVGLFLVLSIPILIVEWILSKVKPEARTKSSWLIIKWAFRACLKVSGTTYTVIGAENVPLDTACLYVGNHRSYFDILLTQIQTPRPTGYVAKVEMLRYPLLLNWMKNIHCTFLDRKDLKKGMKTILENIELLKNGISVCVFPEGTRNKTSELLLPFHDGSLKMAEKSGCPIVPVTLVNTNCIFEDHMPKIAKTHVIIEYGKPIYPNELSKEEKKSLSKDIQNILITTYTKNKKGIDH